ncbi:MULTISPECIES: hypothetical protein [unclassified Nitrosospira]|uniref:hypothetical protein n=1 Tax=unclassified Nitrosospira TaxID=2609267 RepID=UPI000D322139|nr:MULTISPECIES: hypothetical protein [unclassified Nitrosospira]PTR16252.1 hypothetical protein C8R31_102266 [Nitrosospira sp. Nsp2]WON73747.1 hypothetical protein R5L00_14890 [Nitrosospira sp. Is2]
MPQVKYIGSSVKTDSISGIGLRWEPGQVRNVTAEVAERLLAFTDTWVREQAGKALDVEPVGLAEAEKPVEEPLPVIDFHAMDKTALVEFAEDKYNERLDKRLSEETIRHKVITLFTKHEMAD